MISIIKSFGVRLGLCAIIFMALIFHQQILSDVLYHTAKSRVVRVSDMLDQGHGTGAFVKAASGNVYLLTNKHVCGLASGGIIKIKPEGAPFFLGKVLVTAETSDLCVIGNYFGGSFDHSAYSLAKSAVPGDIVHVFGYPKYHVFTMSDGKIIGSEKVSIMKGVVKSKAECSGPGETTVDFCLPAPMDVPMCAIFCIQQYDATTMTALIEPGNSGSPVVNTLGHMVGLIFAGENPDASWGAAMPLTDIRTLLSNF